MSDNLGLRLAIVQSNLTTLWENNGPDEVYARLEQLPKERLLELLMVNIGSRLQKP